MDVQVQIDSRAFERAMVKMAVALGRDLPEVYAEEADLLMRDIIKKTPPIPVKGAGIKRMLGDIWYTVHPLHERFLAHVERRFGRGRYSGRITLNGISKPIAYAKIIHTLPELKAWHHSFRQRSTGRVAGNSGRGLDRPKKAFVSKGLLRSYERQSREHIGAAKGGWAAAQMSVGKGRPLAFWIAKHRKLGHVLKNFQPRLAGQQTFIAANSSPWASNWKARGVAAAALRNRIKVMPLKTERQLKLRAKQSGFGVFGSDIRPGFVSA